MRAPPRLEEEEDVGEEGKRGLEVEQCNISAPQAGVLASPLVIAVLVY
jgi:hypothetical protein